MTSPTPQPAFIDLTGLTNTTHPSVASNEPAGHISTELNAGLLAKAASIPPKYFYNLLGSKLFEAITLLNEYYPTRTEAAIFEVHRAHITQAVQNSGLLNPCLIDLGAGNCAKSAAFIKYLKPAQFVPVDISIEFMRDAASQVQASFPDLNIVGVGLDFSNALMLPAAVQNEDRVFFYPGSSLGNFSPPDALRFLQQIASADQGNARGLLLGIDLVKDTAVLEAAYDDAVGVTAAFNKNLLLNINEQLGTDFDLRQWRHVALFNVSESRIEMHLQAMTNITVRWPGHERAFTSGERIHTENSYKYTLASMTDMLKQSGFSQVQHWTDSASWFGVFWASK